MANTRTSNCSSGVEVDLYWRQCNAPELESHIDRIVDEVFETLKKPGRAWNPWKEEVIKGSIESLISRAASGNLEPVDHVKSLRNGIGDLFEIRFSNLHVTEIRNKIAVDVKTHARLIHVEPIKISVGAIGLLAFEKPDGIDFKTEQDDFIDEAERLEASIRSRNWGVQLRNHRK